MIGNIFPASSDMNDDNTSTDSFDMIMSVEVPDRQHFDPRMKAILSLKRKQCYDEITLSEQIKRFKITTTPGELRCGNVFGSYPVSLYSLLLSCHQWCNEYNTLFHVLDCRKI